MLDLEAFVLVDSYIGMNETLHSHFTHLVHDESTGDYSM